MAILKLLDMVAIAEDIPSRSLIRGQVGTIVEMLGIDMFEVEFCDETGKSYLSTALSSSELIPLHYQPTEAT